MSEIEIIDVEQGSTDWLRVRAGIPTASEFDAVCAKPGPRGGLPASRRKYMMRLLGEIISGEPEPTYSNAHMERGRALEPEARAAYEYETGNTVTRVGFILHRGYRAGYSPDGLIGDDGALEIKTQLPSILCETLLSGRVPSEHTDQLQGALWITGRQWIDFVAYWPGMPLFVRRVHRDEDRIAQIAASVAEFNAELDALVKRLRP